MSTDPITIQKLKSQVMSFRVAELQMLLGFAQKSRSGKKHELQTRAINLLQKGNLTLAVQNKIRELHQQRFAYTNSDSQGSDTSCYGSSSASKVSSSSLSNGLPLPPGASTRGAPQNAANMLNSSLPSDYYSSMPRGLGAFDFSASSPSNSKSYISSMPTPMPYPVLADVKFKILPFFDILGDLLKPATLMPSPGSRYQENNFSFHLTPQQANDVSLSRDIKPDGKVDYGVQIQMRFCLLETSCEQDDNFPPSICVKVNDELCPLPNPLATNKPGVDPKRPSRPVNITTYCRISPTAANQVSIGWASDYNKAYAVGIFLVKRLIANNLLQRIKSKGVRNSEYTRAMIKEKLAQDPDSEIATMILRGSLLCPLGKMRIQIPCRAMTCSHIQCFDALLYLQMNEKKPTWVCPVCDKSALFQHLVIDGLFTEILSQVPGDCTEVQFHDDGSWTPLLPKKELCETVSVNNINKRAKEEPISPQPKKTKSDIEVITLDSDDENEDEGGNDDDEETDDDDTEDAENNGVDKTAEKTSRIHKGSHTGQPSPIISSRSSSNSEAPNISLPSPDSSTGSSICLNVPHNSDGSNNSRSIMESSHTSTPCYAPTNNTRPGINPVAGNFTPNSGPPSMGTRGRISLGGLPYHSRSNINVSPSYPGMPILNPSAAPFYPSNTSKSYSDPYDYVLSNSNSNPMSYGCPNYDVYHGHNHMFNSDMSRELSSYRSGSSSGARPTTDAGPELISLD